MNKTILFFAFFPLFFLFSILTAFAQTSTIQGKVLDTSDRPLQGATVQVGEAGSGTTANAEGNYRLDEVPVGSHTVIVRFVGYTTRRQLITLDAGEELELNFALTEDLLGLDEVIVSGTFNPATKLESSTAITTLDPQHIESRIPRGTSDLLKAVPGVQVISNYGNTGSDVTVRGLPITANSSYRYISLQEDGLPIFEPPGLLFAFPDAMVRQDATIARVEAVRGGSASIFSSNTPGGIVNFISKTGGPELRGTFQNTVGFHGMDRQDINLSGPLSEDWRFSAGGYYRYDEGVRHPGFAANRGGQLKVNVTRLFGTGYLRFYGKYLDENNVWYMGIPFQNYKDPEPIPGGPSLTSGTTFSSLRRELTVPDAFNPGSSTVKEMDSGFDVRYRSLGMELSTGLGDNWDLTFRSRYMNSDNRMNLMIDVADPFPITAFGQPGLPASVPRFVRFVETDEVVTDQQQVANMNGNGLMTVHGLAYSEQPVSNYIANLQTTTRLGNHSLNAGVYYSTFWTEHRLLQAGAFLEIANHPRMLQIMIPDGEGGMTGLTPTDGFAGHNSGFWNLDSHTDLGALYVGDQWDASDRLKLEGGLRLDMNFSSGKAERPVNPGRVEGGEVGGQEVPPGYPAFTPTPQQSRAGMFGSGLYRTWDYTFTTLSGSIGANYRLTDHFAVYARGSRGSRAPTVQQWTFQSSNGSQITGNTVRGEIEHIVQTEAGVKMQAPDWSLLLTGFYSRSKNLISNIHRGQADGSFVFLPITGNTRTLGAEIEAIVRPLEGLNLRLTTTLQDPRFTKFEYEFFVPGSNTHSGQHRRDYSGNLLNDAVRFLGDVTASYTYSRFNLFANYRYIGQRMANRPNTVTIPAYTELMAGAGVSFNRFRISVKGANLFNTQAIGQMASRTGEDILNINSDGTAEILVTTGPNAGSTNITPYTTGLGIMPRSVLASVSYSF